jgi:hypothetical protein
MDSYLKEKFTCECGAVICRGYKRFHVITKQHLEYLQNGVSKLEYLENKKQSKKDIIECECGVTYKAAGNSRHVDTKTHQNYLLCGETKSERIERNLTNYMNMRNEKVLCECCNVHFIKRHLSRHNKSAMHINNQSSKI